MRYEALDTGVRANTLSMKYFFLGAGLAAPGDWQSS